MKKKSVDEINYFCQIYSINVCKYLVFLFISEQVKKTISILTKIKDYLYSNTICIKYHYRNVKEMSYDLAMMSFIDIS